MSSRNNTAQGHARWNRTGMWNACESSVTPRTMIAWDSLAWEGEIAHRAILAVRIVTAATEKWSSYSLFA